MNDVDYRFVAFSLSGRTLDSGRHSLLSIDDTELSNLILVDVAGNRVMAIKESNSGISSVMMQQMKSPTPNPFDEVLNVPVIIGTEGLHQVELSICDMVGTKLFSDNFNLGYGEHIVVLHPGKLHRGLYLITLTLDGKAVQTHKVIKK